MGHTCIDIVGLRLVGVVVQWLVMVIIAMHWQNIVGPHFQLFPSTSTDTVHTVRVIGAGEELVSLCGRIVMPFLFDPGVFGQCKYVYYGKHSEGNRFIRNNQL